MKLDMTTAKAKWYPCLERGCTNEFRSKVHNRERCDGCQEIHEEREKARKADLRRTEALNEVQGELDAALLTYEHTLERGYPYTGGYWDKMAELTTEIGRLERKRNRYV